MRAIESDFGRIVAIGGAEQTASQVVVGLPVSLQDGRPRGWNAREVLGEKELPLDPSERCAVVLSDLALDAASLEHFYWRGGGASEERVPFGAAWQQRCGRAEKVSSLCSSIQVKVTNLGQPIRTSGRCQELSFGSLPKTSDCIASKEPTGRRPVDRSCRLPVNALIERPNRLSQQLAQPEAMARRPLQVTRGNGQRGLRARTEVAAVLVPRPACDCVIARMDPCVSKWMMARRTKESVPSDSKKIGYLFACDQQPKWSFRGASQLQATNTSATWPWRAPFSPFPAKLSDYLFFPGLPRLVLRGSHSQSEHTAETDRHAALLSTAMTADATSVQNGAAGRRLEDRDRIRACSIALSSASSLIGNVTWSELGQALAVTDDALVVLSPLTGLHPTLAAQSRAQDVESHPDWEGRFPHSVIHVHVKSFLQNEHSLRRRLLLESDHSSVDPRFQSVQWSSASWSKPGLGPHGSCLILATTSELDLFVLGAPRNAWTGEWQLLHAISLDPVADLVDPDPASVRQSCGLADGGEEVFTRSRASLRRKQMATEVLCASFLDAQDRDVSAFIVAGTRSGHIAVWQCQALTGHCTFVSASQVSSTGIEKLLVTAGTTDRGIEAPLRIAFQDGDGIRVSNFRVQQGKATLELSTPAFVCSCHVMVSAWHWLKHDLIYATIGKAHVYNVQTGHTTEIALTTEPDSRCDPFSPVISIYEYPRAPCSIHLILQDLRTYRIPSVQAAQAPSPSLALLPSYPPTLVGYPPRTETLQRKHDLHQSFLGYQTDPSSRLSSVCVVGAVRTDERVAFLGYNVSETMRYQMEVHRDAHVAPAAVLDEALERAHLVAGAYLVARVLLALLYTCGQQDAFRDQLLSAIEERWVPLLETPAPSSIKPTEMQIAKRQLLYLLTCRLEEASKTQLTSVGAFKKRHKEAVLHDWLERSRSEAGGPLTTEEVCAACQTQLTLSWSEDQHDFGWARCKNGHVWPRCSVSLATICDREVRVCTGCWAKALVPGKPGQSAGQTALLKAATRCLYCGSCWILR